MYYNSIEIKFGGVFVKKPRILVVGSTNMDFVCSVDRVPEAGETVMSDGEYFIAPGGKGANGAVAAARLGAEIIFCTRIGDDDYGRQLAEMYKNENMDCRFIFVDKEEKTGLAHIYKEADGQNRITVYNGANKKLSADDVEEAFTSYPDALLLQCEADPIACLFAIEQANKQKIPVFFDMAPIRNDLDLSKVGRCEVISPNETETEFYTGINPGSMDNCLRACIRLYSMIKTKYVVIKLGSRGCFVYDGIHQELISPMNVTPVDTTGAGDAFTAALAVRYMQNGGDIIDAARFANCVGAYTVTGSGAFASFPTLKQLGTFINNYNNG